MKTSIPISTLLSYEEKRAGVKWVNWKIIIDFLNNLPKEQAQAEFLRLSTEESDTRCVIDSIGTWRALEVLYTYTERLSRGLVSERDQYWQELLDNTKSIRNRLLLVKEELVSLIHVIETPVHILSIGSGSARPVLEAIASLKGTPETKLLLVDQDETALDFSEVLAGEFQVNHTERKKGNFLRIARTCKDFQPHVVEMVGLLDYLEDDRCIHILKEVLKTLVPGGQLITGNIAPNLEAPFVTAGINWPMIYRTPEELQKLLEQAGFLSERTRIIQETLGIHTLAIAQKVEGS